MLSGKQIRQIQEALLSAFPSRDELAMVVRLELNENLDTIAGGENLRVVVFKLVTWAERVGRIPKLIQGAQAQNGGNPEIQKLVKDSATWAGQVQSSLTPAPVPAVTGPAVTQPATIDIFLSYSRANATLMRRLESDLRTAGFTVWIDEGLEPGTPSWQAAIEEAIRQAPCLIVLLTPHSKASLWVQNEVTYASRLGKRIIPLLADGDVGTAVPLSLINTQWVDIRQAYERAVHQQLLPALQRHLRSGESVSVLRQTPINFDWVTIPAGEFLMGSDKRKDKQAYDVETPQHTLYLPKYRIARVPVTVAQFATFIEATGHRTAAEEQGEAYVWTGLKFDSVKGANWAHPRGLESDVRQKQNHPVTCVSWHDAIAFCKWAGVRLPSEAEWEKAARGADGRILPWGDQDPTQKLCNFYRNIGDTTPVGNYSPQGDSPYGCVDMAGNVWEWAMSLWGTNSEKPDFGYPYRAGDGRENPNASDMVLRVLRGGSWLNGDQNVRCACRGGSNPDDRLNLIGFRVVSPGS